MPSIPTDSLVSRFIHSLSIPASLALTATGQRGVAGAYPSSRVYILDKSPVYRKATWEDKQAFTLTLGPI